MAIPEMATLLIYLLIGGLIVFVALWAIDEMGLGQPWRTIIIVVIAIIAILFLLRLLNIA